MYSYLKGSVTVIKAVRSSALNPTLCHVATVHLTYSAIYWDTMSCCSSTLYFKHKGKTLFVRKEIISPALILGKYRGRLGVDERERLYFH